MSGGRFDSSRPHLRVPVTVRDLELGAVVARDVVELSDTGQTTRSSAI